MKKLREGEVFELEIPDVLRVKGTGLKKWVRVEWQMLTNKIEFEGAELTEYKHKNGHVINFGSKSGFYLSAHLSWHFSTKKATTNVCSGNFKAFVRTIEALKKTLLKETVGSTRPPTTTECYGHFDEDQEACRQVCEISGPCRRETALPGPQGIKVSKREQAINNLIANSSGPDAVQDPDLTGLTILKDDPGCLLCQSEKDRVRIGGRMFKALFFHNGYYMVQTDVTEWVPEENLLCVGIKEDATIETDQVSLLVELVTAYEQHRIASYKAEMHPADFYPNFIQEKPSVAMAASQEETIRQTERANVKQSLVDVMEFLNHEFDCDLRNTVQEMAASQEMSAQKLRALLEREKAEKAVLGKVIQSLEQQPEKVQDPVDKPEEVQLPRRPNIPCGTTMGHGESCVDGHLCGSCVYIQKLEEKTSMVPPAWDEGLAPVEDLEGVWNGLNAEVEEDE